MKVCRKCGEEKPLTEFHRNSRAKDGLYCYCKPCAIARASAWQKANPEKVNEKNRRWRETNRDRVRATMAEWRRKNLEKVRKTSRDWARKKRQNNSEGVLEYQRRWRAENRERDRQRYRDYYRRNKELCRLKNMRRRVQAPPWLTKEHKREIRDKCKLALMLSNQGVQYHVDHIWPLRGKDAWGLHVPWNLQIIPAELNYKKSNKRPDQAHIIQELAPCPN